MATSEDVIKFQDLSNNDRILCTTRDHTRDLQRSVQAMELVDEIRKVHVELMEASGLVVAKNEDLTRSEMLVSILRNYLAIRKADLLAFQMETGQV
jgi:hypothetical protein